MSILPESAKKIVLPNMYPVIQKFPDQKITDVYSAAELELNIHKEEFKRIIEPGKTAAVLVGSRGIANLKFVVKATIEMLKSLDVEPFIIPAMGSHGGGIAEEQRKMIEAYGVTEEYLNVPIYSSMETVIIGKTESGIPVHIDKTASNADYIIPIGRIKAHTDFDGPIESGLCKMLSIGLGKHNGCSTLHKEGIEEFHTIIPEVASTVIKTKNIPFGVSIIENAHENTHMVKVVLGKNILEEEPNLLSISKSLMPRLYFDHIDVLIIEQVGKSVSGGGMDSNIMGRSGMGISPYYKGPSITRIVVLDLTEDTPYNAMGLGFADFITKKLYDKIDFNATYTNAIAAGSPVCGKIPIALEDEDDALRAAIQTCPKVDANNAKIVRIKDTLHLVNIEVSENLLAYCRSNDQFTV